MRKKILKKQNEMAMKRLARADNENMHRSTQDLQYKRDVLLQDILELNNRLASVNANKDALEAKLKRCMTEVVLCEKMIGSFGKV